MKTLGPYELNRVHHGYAPDCLKALPDNSIHCVVTSPPYFGLRVYAGLEPQKWGDGWTGLLGNESSPREYVSHLVEIFEEVRRVLRPDGVMWLNMGDSYANIRPRGHFGDQGDTSTGVHGELVPERDWVCWNLKPKDLVGMPWRIAFALQDKGWWLRSDVVWSKPNPMPDSTEDRPTKAHEYVFLFTKSAKYFYDKESVKEPISKSMEAAISRGPRRSREYKHDESSRMGKTSGNRAFSDPDSLARIAEGRNLRSVWTIATSGFDLEVCEACGKMYETGAFRRLPRKIVEGDEKPICVCGRWDAWLSHFASFPPSLVEIPVKAGTSEKGCCAKCGAPWERDIRYESPGDHSKVVATYEDKGVLNRRMHPGPHHAVEKRSAGWKPTCNCPGLDGDHPGSDCADEDNWPRVPCVVLDPFAGTGTTLAVALGLGRSAIGFDASEKYVKSIAATRVEAAKKGMTVSEIQAGQLSLFEEES